MFKKLQLVARLLSIVAFIALAAALAPSAEAGELAGQDGFEPVVKADGATPSSCLLAQRWASENKELLPRDYEGFTSLPLSHRKAAYRNFTISERHHLWQHQWLKALQQNTLTEEQSDVLLEALQLLTPETFEALEAEEGWRHEQAREQVRSFAERALAAFGKDGARELFAQIGSVSSRKVVLVDTDVDSNITRSLSSASVAEACSCSQSEDFCTDGFGCGEDSDGCTTIEDECGWFWASDCNGECLGSPTQN